MEIRVLDAVVHFQPFEKAFLHVAGTEGQPIADVVKEQTGPFRKQPAHEKSFERDIVDGGAVLNRKEVENIAAEHEQRVGAAVPASGQFQRPAAQRQPRLGSGRALRWRSWRWRLSSFHIRFQYPGK